MALFVMNGESACLPTAIWRLAAMRLVAPPGPARADNAQQSCLQSSPKKTTENLQYKKLVIFSGLKPGRGSERAFCHVIMTSSCKYEPLDVNLSVHVPADKISLTH